MRGAVSFPQVHAAPASFDVMISCFELASMQCLRYGCHVKMRGGRPLKGTLRQEAEITEMHQNSMRCIEQCRRNMMKNNAIRQKEESAPETHDA